LVAASPPPERLALTPDLDGRPPEPHAVVTDAEAEMPLPSNPQTFFLGGIFALSVSATLYLASPIILPVVLAFVLKLLLRICAMIVCFAIFPLSDGWAQLYCSPDWTPAYKCMEHCGPCPGDAAPQPPPYVAPQPAGVIRFVSKFGSRPLYF
jgi:hypothetical protein